MKAIRLGLLILVALLEGSFSSYGKPCNAPPIVVESAKKASYEGLWIRWTDHACQPRAAFLVHNDRKDPRGLFGGYLREYQYEFQGKTRVLNTTHYHYPGFGMTINHYQNPDGTGGSSASSSLYFRGQWQKYLQGPHHYIHQFKWLIRIGRVMVPTTVHWLFRTGVSHPIYSISYDMRQIKDGDLIADTRSPYGNINWDGDGKSIVDGVEWGDRYRFKTTSTPLTMASSWDYTEKNKVPFVRVYSRQSNAMQASIQTQFWSEQDAGGYWFGRNWGRTSKNRECEVLHKIRRTCRKDADPHTMPEVWNWAYQTINYQFQTDPHSKRFAWGSNYGALGLSKYTDMGGGERSGWPEQSYAVFVVFSSFSSGGFESLKSFIESKDQVEIKVAGAELVEEGFDGVGRATRVSYRPAGYDHRYGSWRLKAKSEAMKLDVSGLTTDRGITLVIEDWPTADYQLKLSPETPAYSSYQHQSKELWITVPAGRGKRSIELYPSSKRMP
ncbi:hypothetical protein [Pseudobacteriovorax antillogorgiicola]|uniref:Uncharacterized protein n=2 Tax=Pseudobacteriovorax antillogorgiicola TaxID=1513793 RepID=A0A1Y6BMI3_9BACT|nr:hypothetical protein [Pseudobacteriovorax antillogorgiicola]TCS55535.1 hypothetical protein EDD56_105258 [Pseudobacteriovorax antillogorgiicola]SMF11236.1 hypothetical protein SAMN06296036_10566 [Pseudobacteriovorax antillogorgiicola]